MCTPQHQLSEEDSTAKKHERNSIYMSAYPMQCPLFCHTLSKFMVQPKPTVQNRVLNMQTNVPVMTPKKKKKKVLYFWSSTKVSAYLWYKMETVMNLNSQLRVYQKL